MMSPVIRLLETKLPIDSLSEALMVRINNKIKAQENAFIEKKLLRLCLDNIKHQDDSRNSTD